MQEAGEDFLSAGHILLQAWGFCCLSAGQAHNQQERLSCRVLQKVSHTSSVRCFSKCRFPLNQDLLALVLGGKVT